jgi:hypothetical protein
MNSLRVSEFVKLVVGVALMQSQEQDVFVLITYVIETIQWSPYIQKLTYLFHFDNLLALVKYAYPEKYSQKRKDVTGDCNKTTFIDVLNF